MKRNLLLVPLLAIALLSGCNTNNASQGNQSYEDSSTLTSDSSDSSSSSSESSESSSSSSEDEGDEYYTGYYSSINKSWTGTKLLTELNSLNNKMRKKTIGYDDMRELFKYTDTAEGVEGGKIVGFYDNALIGPSWDSGKTWNREHVWPNSHGGGKKGDLASPYVDADMHMVRPAATSTNGDRGNAFFGKSIYDPGTTYAEYRGISARIIFYCAIADTRLEIIDSSDGNGHQMGKLSDMLEWNLQYLPDTSNTASLALRVEQNRNETIYSRSDLQGNRNPFIDHPEFGCKIWGDTNDATRAICGM